MSTDLKTLWRLGGLSGLIAAFGVPLFVALFYLVAPGLGFDPNQFSNPDHTLAFFNNQPFFVRLIGLINLVTMTASILLILALSIQLYPLANGRVIVGGTLGVLAWLMILIGEHADLSAFVHLSQRYVEEPDLAKTGFALAVAFGRQARGWGYLLLALSLAALSMPLGRSSNWPAVLRWITLVIVPFAFLLFVFENVLLVDTSSALFAQVFAPVGVLLAIWNGWIGWGLWKLSMPRAS